MAIDSNMRRDHCRLERGRTRFLAGSQVVECEFERGWAACSDGGSMRFSGPPPRSWKLRLPSPGRHRPLAAARAAVAALAAPLGGSLQLHYTAVVAHRTATGPLIGSQPPLRTSAVWSLTGWLKTASNGARIPLGWSGSGDGLDWIQEGAGGEIRQCARLLSSASSAEKGVFDTVLSPAAAAVLAHEAIGHVAEACVGPRPRRLPSRIAGEAISAVDHSLEAGGPARYEYDDENVRCLGPTPVVHEGVLVAELHSQESANSSGTLPTGHGRCDSVWHRPIPRFSNLICRGGKRPEEALIDTVADGLYILRLANGVYNGASVTADITLAERIRSGKRTGTYWTGGRIEEAPDVLLRVAEVADNATFHDNALCGKAGQLLFDVGTAAPSLLLRKMRVLA
jgi:hypothetical protein